jgi:hypothetical protein
MPPPPFVAAVESGPALHEANESVAIYGMLAAPSLGDVSCLHRRTTIMLFGQDPSFAVNIEEASSQVRAVLDVAGSKS